jgi:hypothetical protein
MRISIDDCIAITTNEQWYENQKMEFSNAFDSKHAFSSTREKVAPIQLVVRLQGVSI